MTAKSLLVKVGVDTTALEAGMKRADASIQNHAAQFKKAGMAMTVAGAAILGTIGMMMKSYVKAGDEVHKMAQRTGFATETLSELKYAAEISGTNIESLEKGVKKMSKTIVDACDGLTTYQRAFDRIGIEYEKLIGLSPEEQFEKIAVAIAAVEDPTIRAATAQDIFGRAGTQLLPLFAQGVEGMEALRQKAHELGIVFDQEAADKAARLADAQTTLKSAMQGVTIAIADNLAPAISNLVEKISDIVAKVGAWIKAHPGLAEGIGKAAIALGALLAVFGPILIILPKLVAGIGMLKGAFTAMLGPLGLIVTAAAAAGYAINKLINNYKASQDAAMESYIKIGQTMGDYMKLRQKVIKEDIMSQEEWRAMWIKHGRDYKEVMKAIATLPEYAHIKEKLKEMQDEQKKTGEASTDMYTEIKESSEKVANLMDTMTDNIRKATMSEWEYRVVKAREIYAERKAILEEEKAGKEAFMLLEKDYALELEQIEKDRTEAVKEQYKARGEALMAYFEDVKKKHETAQGFIRDYTDIVKQLSLDAFEYREYQIEQWYEAQLKALDDAELDVRDYVAAVTALTESYTEQLIENDEDRTDSEDEENKKRVENARAAWEERYQNILGFIDDVSGVFGGFFIDLLSKGSTFSDDLKGLWGGIKDSFKSMLADMMAEWTKSFLEEILKGITDELIPALKSVPEEGGKALDNLNEKASAALGEGGLLGIVKNVATTIATVLTTLATAIATVLTTLAVAVATTIVTVATAIGAAIVILATAIATAAGILAAAAPAILVFGAAIIALYAALKLVQAITGAFMSKGEKKIVRRLEHLIDIGQQQIKLLEVINNAALMIQGPIMECLNNTMAATRASYQRLNTIDQKVGAIRWWMPLFHNRFFDIIGLLGDMKSELTNSVNNLTTQMNQSLSTLSIQVTSSVKNLSSEMGGYIGGLSLEMSESMEGLSSSMDGMSNNIVSSVDGVYDSIEHMSDKMQDSLGDIAAKDLSVHIENIVPDRPTSVIKAASAAIKLPVSLSKPRGEISKSDIHILENTTFHVDGTKNPEETANQIVNLINSNLVKRKFQKALGMA